MNKKEWRLGPILVVDDDLGILNLLKTVLRSKGFAVDTSSSGVDALGKVQEGSYDLILTDICMPGCDGNHVARTARAIKKDIPIIGMSGTPWLAGGCFDQVIKKPFDLKSLVDLLAHFVSKRQQTYSC